ncbi:MAG: hypothetical protein GVY26_13140 [Bacteroidetes bacterium]|jgi:hypothetical protein|nr:hypothetical protein [Bacteroidota bacterium]
MASTKSYYDQILENQTKLFNAMSDYTNAVMEMMMPSKDTADKAGEMLNDYFTKVNEMAEGMASKEKMEHYQKDFWTAFTEDYTKSMELSMDLYKKSTEYMKDMWATNPVETQQERTKKLTELYQNSMKAMYDTTTANTQVVREYFA